VSSRHIQHQQPVVVLGASSAGLFAAHLLARQHIPVDIYERRDRLDPKPRTLIVTPELLRVLGSSAQTAVVNRVHTLELRTARRAVPIRLREPDLIIERAELLRILVARAQASGARLHTGCYFEELETDGGRVVVGLRRRDTDTLEHVPAETIIAADGVRSRVARCLGDQPQPCVSVVQAHVALPTPIDAGVGQVWFEPRATPYFFWLCLESATTAVVGLVDGSAATIRSKLDKFLSDRRMEPLDYQAAVIPLYRPRRSPARRLGRTNILMIGDAAGHVKVTTVGGTVSGLLGAQAAANSIIHASSYVSELRATDRELHLHWWLRELMKRLHEHEYDALLHLLSGKVAQLLEIHNRDRLVGGMWPIMAAQPRLTWLVAQVLWRGWAGV
jgi:flavin-dependent dehydrogenase